MSLRHHTFKSMFAFDLGGAATTRHKLGHVESTYLPVRDGTRVALDVVRPMGDSAETKRNTILVMTRYWRGVKGELSNRWADLFVPHGYSVVVGDVRGTGASFGVWPHPRTRSETLDFSEVLDWIVAQPWSTGQVVGCGVSYTANTSDWMAERNHPALKGIIPRYADYDPYEDEFFPGGVPNASFGQGWSDANKALDHNVRSVDSTYVTMGFVYDAERAPGVRPVGLDGEADLNAAVRQHETVPSLWEGFKHMTFKDDRPESWAGDSMLDWSIMEVADRVSRSGTPIQNWASWFDGGTAQGAIRRFMQQSNPMNVIIGPWSHGSAMARDPLREVGAATAQPTLEAIDVHFAELCFNGEAAREHGKLLHYYTLGEGAWKSTRSWPPPAARHRWYLGSGSRLSSSPDEIGFDPLQVDPEAGDPTPTRWDFAPTVNLARDHRGLDAASLAYTSEPLTRDLEITGHPVVHLNIISTREDGSFFVYLEAVRPDGVSCYLTEGQLRALHRKVWTESPFSELGPQHSYLKRDAEPLTPGKATVLAFTLHPISARLPAGYRLRVVLSGSDHPTFTNVPTDGPPPFLKFHRGTTGCYIDLPIIGS
ncbi:CocE/NonD family hydrolase [Mesorhizobium sp. M7A.F.Ca.MR.176.00.0.0]|uniref:CocE/NonD family hydrolase n=1 Tax=unclassified Mesorhizobium TaxID=325217 RepID=UPI000FD1A66F|nr:CocE/NonD family hydrolase [Mesorhizobium sp. M7A.F.Ca.MR.176.00.0.0]RUU87019.1 CocE/NonD family hydrolase [Mesorhizobium sp. M7A.F.Ca.MR.176.00.0.0]